MDLIINAVGGLQAGLAFVRHHWELRLRKYETTA